MATGQDPVKRVLPLLLLLIAGWQLGQGFYIDAKAVVAQWLLQYAWTQSLAGGARVRPWPWADTWPVARLQVERLGVDQIVLAGASGRTLAFGPGHVTGTAAPGDHGNSAISGHRDTHFAFLQELRNDDLVTLALPDGRQLTYRVAQLAVRDHRAGWALQGDDPELTLITCYPFDALPPGGPLRYLVSAYPASRMRASTRAASNPARSITRG